MSLPQIDSDLIGVSGPPVVSVPPPISPPSLPPPVPSPLYLQIDSDLMGVSGPPVVSVPAKANKGGGGCEGTYELMVNAQLGGTVQVAL